MSTEAVVTPLPGAEQRLASDPPAAPASPLLAMRRFLARKPKLRVVAWTVAAVAFLALLPLVYLCWYWLPLRLWDWAMAAWWHWAPAALGYLFLFCIPVWGAMLANAFASTLASLALEGEEAVVRQAQQTIRETEEDAIARLEQTDAAGLLPLLKYSRAQLEAYYAVGLSQTRKSFYNSVLAMWLGFVLLMLGVAFYVGPVEQLGLKPPSQDFRNLIMGGAAIIEFISALFLWVYRSSTAQLTYFYNRQMHSHTSILCFRIASTMETSKGDDVKRLIVEKALDWTGAPERPPLAGGRGMRALVPVLGAKAA
ncbi:MAG: hypothetical protein JWQ76_2853 [Ramlibacter sp.]|nr:hypothetical protein [Ramlibacter sp.]